MDYSVFNDLNNYFEDRGYQQIPTDSETVKMYGAYQKSHLYLINVISLSSQYRFDENLYRQYKEVTKKQFLGVDADKVILLNLVLTEMPDSIYHQINYQPELDEMFVDINWIIDTEKKVLIVPDKQINNVIGLERDIKRILDEDAPAIIKLDKLKNVPKITYCLIIFNVLAWLIMEYKGSTLYAPNLIQYGALYSASVIYQGEYWRLISSMFVHIGSTHLVFNMFSLYIFGGRLEKYVTSFQYLTIYIVSGIMGAGLSLAINVLMGNVLVAAGASAAIYGVIGSIFMYSRLAHKNIEGLNAYILGIYFIIGIAMSVFAGNIDTKAHIGGFIAGILITSIIYMRTKKNHHRHNKI